jgi:hypothetical protein
MARKARKRRFREARELKRGFDDGLFAEGDRTLADLLARDSTGINELTEGISDSAPECVDSLDDGPQQDR